MEEEEEKKKEQEEEAREKKTELKGTNNKVKRTRDLLLEINCLLDKFGYRERLPRPIRLATY